MRITVTIVVWLNLLVVAAVVGLRSGYASLRNFRARPSQAALGGHGEVLRLLCRTETRTKLVHFEYYRRFWPECLLRVQCRLPTFLRPLRPLAKAGIRSYAAKVTSGAMHEAIESFESCSAEDCLPREWSLGLIVYMFVQPAARRCGLGSMLIQQCKRFSRQRGDTHLLLIHDDKGSGRLVQFYKAHGFLDVSTAVPSGMIFRI